MATESPFARNPHLKRILSEASRVFTEHGAQGFIVGGAIRDQLHNHLHGTRLGLEELDIYVKGPFPAVVEGLGRMPGAKTGEVDLFSAKLSIPYGDKKGNSIDLHLRPIPEPGQDTPVSRIKRYFRNRFDFTHNGVGILLEHALLPDWHTFVFHPDDVKPLEDISRRELHIINEGILEDPRRVFRALRFMEKLKLAPSPETVKLMRRGAKNIWGFEPTKRAKYLRETLREYSNAESFLHTLKTLKLDRSDYIHFQREVLKVFSNLKR